MARVSVNSESGLRDLDRWIELSETSLSYERILDLLIREQTLGVGSAELRVFIEERTPGSFKEMCNIAEQYLKTDGKFFPTLVNVGQA